MRHKQARFLGFATAEGLIEACRHRRTICVTALTTSRASGGIGTDQCHLRLECDLGHAIGYCQMPLGSVPTFFGEVRPESLAERLQRRADSARDLAVRWLEGQGFEVVEASYARPIDYVFLDGKCGFLDFDPADDTFRLKESGQ